MQLHNGVMGVARSRERECSGKMALVKRTSFEDADCPVARSVDALGDWWSLLIIRDAFMGIRRFSEFQKSLGCAKNILTVRLRALVDRGTLTMAPPPAGSTSPAELAH